MFPAFMTTFAIVSAVARVVEMRAERTAVAFIEAVVDFLAVICHLSSLHHLALPTALESITPPQETDSERT